MTIYNSSFEGLIDSSLNNNSGGTFYGGLIAFSENQYFNITRSYADVKIIAKDYFGGLVGFVRNLAGFNPAQNSTISNSYGHSELIETYGADSNPGGTARAAGIIGYLFNASVQVEEIYSVSNIEKSTAAGPIYGTCFFIQEQFNYDAFALENITSGNFATSFNCSRTGVNFETEEDMKLKSTYTNWDFDNIWGIISGQSFPRFRWQFGDSDGDGILDFEDNLFGSENSVNSTGVSTINVSVDGQSSGNLNGSYAGNQPVTIRDGSTKLISFNHNFSSRAINFSKWKIVKEPAALLVNGIDLSEGETKNFTLDFPSGSFCIKDAEVTEVNNITDGCDGDSEVYFTNFDCLTNTSKTVNDNQIQCKKINDKYEISGLLNSLVVGQNASLEVNDTTQNGSTLFLTPIVFSARYINLTDDSLILGASCNLTTNSQTYNMVSNGSHYVASHSYSS